MSVLFATNRPHGVVLGIKSASNARSLGIVSGVTRGGLLVDDILLELSTILVLRLLLLNQHLLVLLSLLLSIRILTLVDVLFLRWHCLRVCEHVVAPHDWPNTLVLRTL